MLAQPLASTSTHPPISSQQAHPQSRTKPTTRPNQLLHSITPPKKKTESSAEAYATANSININQPLSSSHPITASTSGSGSTSKREKAKPIFEWFTRKLGGHRRATLSDASNHIRQSTSADQSGSTSATLNKHRHRREVSTPPPLPLTTFRSRHVPVNHTNTKNPPERDENNSIMTRTESHSLRSYSFAGTMERERRREMNNPYPFIPIPPRFGGGSYGGAGWAGGGGGGRSISISLDDTESRALSGSIYHESPSLGGSRTPSIRSIRSGVSLASSLPSRRVSNTDESVSRSRRRYADEDASLRPIAPSHSSSPTRSVSTSLVTESMSTRPFPAFRGSISSTGAASASSVVSSDEIDYTSSLVHGGSGGDYSPRRPTSSVSTKPTTVLSIDSAPRPAHIAQVPLQSSPLRTNGVSSSHSSNDPSTSTSATTSGISAARAVMIQTTGEDDTTPLSTPILSPTSLLTDSPTSPTLNQAPTFRVPHPGNNPRPLAVPWDNASMVTLASSTFAMNTGGGGGGGAGSVSGHSTSGNIGQASSISKLRDGGQPAPPPMSITTRSNPPSIIWGPTSYQDRPLSTYSTTQYQTSASLRTGYGTYGGGASSTHGNGGYLVDDDASIKGLRGRRGSWESGDSRWSWRGNKLIPGGGSGGGGGGGGGGEGVGMGHRASFQSVVGRKEEERRKSDGQSLRFDSGDNGEIVDGTEEGEGRNEGGVGLVGLTERGEVGHEKEVWLDEIDVVGKGQAGFGRSLSDPVGLIV